MNKTVFLLYLNDDGDAYGIYSTLEKAQTSAVKIFPHIIDPQDTWKRSQHTWYITKDMDEIRITERDVE
jgi:hypothetical protein